MLGRTEGRRRRGPQRTRRLDDLIDIIMSLSKLQEMVGDREAWRAAVHGVIKTLQLKNNSSNPGINFKIHSTHLHVRLDYPERPCGV